MARKRLSARSPQLLLRTVEFRSISARVGIFAEHPRREEPRIESRPWLELRGRLEEPVNGAQDVLFSAYPEDDVRLGTARPASVGAVIGFRPVMSVVLSWPHRDFDRFWALVLAGKLGFAHLCLTQPSYGKALVLNASFSTEREE